MVSMQSSKKMQGSAKSNSSWSNGNWSDSKPVEELELEDANFKPLTANEAEQWRKKNPALSLWAVLMWQSVATLVVALIAWLITGNAKAGWSAGYGGLAVLIPAALFSRGVMRYQKIPNPSRALLGLAMWEMTKVLLTIGLLLAAPKFIVNVNWLALLIGMMVVLKMYVVALVLQSRVRVVKDS